MMNARIHVTFDPESARRAGHDLEERCRVATDRLIKLGHELGGDLRGLERSVQRFGRDLQEPTSDLTQAFRAFWLTLGRDARRLAPGRRR